MFTLALLTSFSGVAMVKRGIGGLFCMAETNPLARRAKLLSADQSDSLQLGSGVGGFWPCSGFRVGFEAESF